MVVIITDISERKRSEQLQQLEHSVTRLLAESRSIEEAMQQVLRTIGEPGGWAYGARWVLNQQEQRLHCLEVWHANQAEVAAFAGYNRKHRGVLRGPPGGLLSRVWADIHWATMPATVC